MIRAKSFVIALCAASLSTGASIQAAAAPRPAKPQLMVLGSYHLDNPARDISNTKIEDVLSLQRQKEIQTLVDQLAAFHPTHVAVEWEASDQAGLDKRYAAYRAGTYTLKRDERDQIGLRLAAKLGLPRVDAIDWNQEPPGKDEDYDFPAWLKAHGRQADWDAFQKQGKADADAAAARNQCRSIIDWYRDLATPQTFAQYERPYYKIATFGDAQANPGAAWVGAWWARNLRIYGNLLKVGGAPGERTIAIFGQGHAYPLRTYAVQSGSFTLIEPRRFLKSHGGEPKACPPRS